MTHIGGQADYFANFWPSEAGVTDISPHVRLNCLTSSEIIVSCLELWLWGENVGMWVAALQIAVVGGFENFNVLLNCVLTRNKGVLQNILPDVSTCVLAPLLTGPPIRVLSVGYGVTNAGT